jgi:hypothetical protein
MDAGEPTQGYTNSSEPPQSEFPLFEPPQFEPPQFEPPQYPYEPPQSEPPQYEPVQFEPPQYPYEPPQSEPPYYGYEPEPAFSMRTIVMIVIGTAIAIIVVGIIGGILVVNRSTRLSHHAVERYIADTYNVGVICNQGHDMPVAAGRTYACVGNGVTLQVHVLDGHGRYEVSEGGPTSTQS